MEHEIAYAMVNRSCSVPLDRLQYMRARADDQIGSGVYATMSEDSLILVKLGFPSGRPKIMQVDDYMICVALCAADLLSERLRVRFERRQQALHFTICAPAEDMARAQGCNTACRGISSLDHKQRRAGRFRPGCPIP